MSGYEMSPFERGKQKREDEEFEHVAESLGFDSFDEADKEAYASYREYLQQRPRNQREASAQNIENNIREVRELMAAPEGVDDVDPFNELSLIELARVSRGAIEHDDPTLALDAKRSIDGRLSQLSEKYNWSDPTVEAHRHTLAKIYGSEVEQLDSRVAEYVDRESFLDDRSFREESDLEGGNEAKSELDVHIARLQQEIQDMEHAASADLEGLLRRGVREGNLNERVGGAAHSDSLWYMIAVGEQGISRIAAEYGGEVAELIDKGLLSAAQNYLAEKERDDAELKVLLDLLPEDSSRTVKLRELILDDLSGQSFDEGEGREPEGSELLDDPDSLINFDTSNLSPEEIADRTVEIVDDVRQGHIERINTDEGSIVGIAQGKHVRPNVYYSDRQVRYESIAHNPRYQKFNYEELMRPFREGASKSLDTMFASRRGSDIVFGVGDGVSSNELSIRASTMLREYFNDFDPRDLDGREEVARAMKNGFNEIRRGLFEEIQGEFPDENERRERMRNMATTACVGSIIERDGKRHLIILNAGDSRIGVRKGESGEFYWLTQDQTGERSNYITNAISPEVDPDSSRDIVTFGEVEEGDILVAVTDGVIGDRVEDQHSDSWYGDVLSSNTLEEATRILVEETAKVDDAAAIAVRV